MNNKQKTIALLAAFLVVVGLLGYYFANQEEKPTPPTTPEEIEEFPKTYKDDRGINWSVFGEYEAALEVVEERVFIVVREEDTHRGVSRIPTEIYKNFAKTLPPGLEEEGAILYFAVNDEFKKLYIFIDIPEYRGATGNTSWNIIMSDFAGKNLQYFGAGGGGGIQSFKFSPDKKFMSHITSWGYSAVFFEHDLFIYDLITREGFSLRKHRDVEDFVKGKNFSPTDTLRIVNFIDNYRWLNNEVIEFTHYFLKTFPLSEKISPEETWQYNVVTGEYTFVKAE